MPNNGLLGAPDSGGVISKILLPTGTEYEIKDAWARNQIEAITGGSALVFKGVSTTALTDGGTENPIVGGTEITEKTIGDIYFYGTGEYIWNGTTWNELGNLESLGSLAYKDTATVTASTSYQPKGTIGNLTFTGDTLTMSTSYTPAGTVSVSPSGYSTAAYEVTTAATGTKTYTPAGNISAPTFTGTTATISMSSSYTPEGQITVTKNTDTIGVTATTANTSTKAHAYQPKGTISTPTISVNSAGATATINNPTAKSVASGLTTSVPGATANNAITYTAVVGERLLLYSIGYDTTDSISTSSVTVKTGDASYTSNAPTFTGTTVYLETDETELMTNATFTGTTATISMSTTYQPAGTNSAPTFTGTSARLVTSSITIPNAFSGSLTGTPATITVSGTPTGSINTPTFTGTTSTITVSGTAS